MRHCRLLRAAVPVVGCVLLVAACDTGAGPSAASSPIVVVAPSQLDDEDLAGWIRFRTAMGLQADPQWVASVAADPRSRVGITEWGLPLLPNEVAALQARRPPPADANAILRDYGSAYAVQWGGYVAAANGGFVALVTGDEAAHRQRLSALLAGVPVSTRRVAYSLVSLHSFADAVRRQASSFPAFGALLFGVDVLDADNAVRLSLTGDKDAEPGIRRWLGDPGWLRVTWVETGWRGGVGSAEVRIVSPAGSLPSMLECRAVSADASVPVDIVMRASADGTCSFAALPAVRLSFVVSEITAGRDDPSPLASVRALINEGRHEQLTVTLP